MSGHTRYVRESQETRHEAAVDARIKAAGIVVARAQQAVERYERAATSATYAARYGGHAAGYRLTEARKALAAAETEYRVAAQEYQGWSRAYLVTNSGGHVHRSMHCTTCFATTQFEWVTALSGATDDEVVDLAGERACTVCYEDAPVEKLTQATRVFSESELEAQARAAEREAKKVAARSAQVTDPVSGRVLYKTVRAATNAIASALGSLVWYGPGHPEGAEWLATIEQARAALAAKGVEFDYDAALARTRKRVEKEAREGHAQAQRQGWVEKDEPFKFEPKF
jgi:hypothetical protein